MSVQLAPGLVLAFLLALVRATAWVSFAPPFNSRQIPPIAKIGLAAALAISVAPHLNPTPSADPLVSTPAFIGSVVLQAFTGVALGFVSNLLFSVVSGAGSLIDMFSGFTMSAALDPLNMEQNPVISRTFNLVATTLLFAMNFHLLLIKGFMTSFDAVPLSVTSLSVLSRTVLADVGVFFISALEIAAPIGAVLFLTDVSLGLLTKAAPQLNIFSLGYAIKILVTLLIIGTTLPLLPGAVTNLVDQGIRDGLGVLGLSP